MKGEDGEDGEDGEEGVGGENGGRGEHREHDQADGDDLEGDATRRAEHALRSADNDATNGAGSADGDPIASADDKRAATNTNAVPAAAAASAATSAFDGAFLDGQTPLADLSGLRSRGIRTLAQLNAAEAENIRQATLRYLAAKPSRRKASFDVAWMRRLHREMFGRVWRWAGSFRRSELNLGSPASRIEVEMHTLADDLAAWDASPMPLLEQAVRLHHRAVSIHPFLNGNGRWSRMLANIWLRVHGASPIEWPEPSIGHASEIRESYLDAVRTADRGDFTALVELHARFVP